MNIAQLQRVIVDALEDVKAQDIRVYDTEALTSEFERFVVATATSNRQTRSLAGSVRDKVKEGGGHIVSVEGLETGEWVLVDCGAAVVNIMQPAIREYYKLEELWGSKPVAVKLAGTDKRARSAREPSPEEPAPPTAARKTPARKAATRDSVSGLGAKTAVAKKAASKTVAPRKAAPAKSAPARKPAPRSKAAPVAKTPAARKPAAKSPAVKSPAAKKAAAKTPAARKKSAA